MCRSFVVCLFFICIVQANATPQTTTNAVFTTIVEAYCAASPLAIMWNPAAIPAHFVGDSPDDQLRSRTWTIRFELPTSTGQFDPAVEIIVQDGVANVSPTITVGFIPPSILPASLITGQQALLVVRGVPGLATAPVLRSEVEYDPLAQDWIWGVSVSNNGRPVTVTVVNASTPGDSTPQNCAPSSCQARSVPYLNQGDPAWNPPAYTDPYDYLVAPPHYIKEEGCGMTSLNMALLSAGAVNLPGVTPQSLNPGNLNGFMQVNGLFTRTANANSTGNVDFVTTTTLIAKANSLRLRFDPTTAAGSSATADLDRMLCSSTSPPIIVQVGGMHLDPSTNKCVVTSQYRGHYVVVTGRQLDQSGTLHYTINDPGCAGNSAANAAFKTLDAYNNQFLIRGVVSDPDDLSNLNVYVENNATLSVTNSEGRTGIDSTTGASVQQISDSGYFVDFIDNDVTGATGPGTTYSVQIMNPNPDTYNLQITGLQPGPYTVVVEMITADGNVQPSLSVLGIAAPGSSQTLQLSLPEGANGPTAVSVLASFESTLQDIRNAELIGSINNRGIAQSLTQKVKAAQAASGTTSSNILKAFINEISAQSGKHLTGNVVPVLLQDAQSLLTQLATK